MTSGRHETTVAPSTMTALMTIPSIVGTRCLLHDDATNGGAQHASYDATPIADSVRGTLIANSCGGAYWQAYRHSPQLWQRFPRYARSPGENVRRSSMA